MNHEQMKKTTTMFRSICQPKFKISDELINGMRIGNYPDDRVLKCYCNCMLDISLITKKGKLMYDIAKKQIEAMIPIDMEDDYMKALDFCKDTGEI